MHACSGKPCNTQCTDCTCFYRPLQHSQGTPKTFWFLVISNDCFSTQQLNIYFITLFINTNISRYVYWGLRLLENWNKFCGRRQVTQHNLTTESFGCIILHSTSQKVKKQLTIKLPRIFLIKRNRVIIGSSFSRKKLGPSLKAVKNLMPIYHKENYDIIG